MLIKYEKLDEYTKLGIILYLHRYLKIRKNVARDRYSIEIVIRNNNILPSTYIIPLKAGAEYYIFYYNITYLLLLFNIGLFESEDDVCNARIAEHVCRPVGIAIHTRVVLYTDL